MRHRRSLSSVFQNVKWKSSRENVTGRDDVAEPRNPVPSRRPSKRVSKEMISGPFDGAPISTPPKLEILTEIPRDGLQRSSTFRTTLEKAVDDINTKYDTSSTTCVPIKQEGEATNITYPTFRKMSEINPRSNFRPRYNVATFVPGPSTPALPLAVELNGASQNDLNHPRLSVHLQRDINLGPHKIDDVLHQTPYQQHPIPGTFPEESGPYQDPYDMTETEPFPLLRSVDATRTPSLGMENCEKGHNPADSSQQINASPGSTVAQLGCSPKIIHIDSTDDGLSSKPCFPHLPTTECLITPDDVTSSSVCNIKRPRVVTASSIISSDTIHQTGSSEGGGSERKCSASSGETGVPSVSELVSKFRRMESTSDGQGENSSSGERELHTATVLSGRSKLYQTPPIQVSNDSNVEPGLGSSYNDNPMDSSPIVIPTTEQAVGSVDDTDGACQSKQDKN